MPTKTRINGQNYTQLPRLVSDGIALKGLPQTAGYPAGYGDLVSAIATSKRLVYRLGTIGDSRLANAYVSPSPGNGAQSQAYQNQMTGTWLRALSMQRVDLLPEFQFATSGANTTQILAQAQAMAALSVKPDICLINGGTNDFSASATLAAAQLAFSNITSAATTLQSAGILPVIEVDTPRTTASWTADAGVVSSEYNRLLRLWCSENNVLLSDSEPQYNIPATGEPAAGYNISDGIHSSCTGSCIRALSFLNALDPILSKHTWRQGSVRDSYSATLNPKGNQLAGALFLGTGGVSNGAGASGTVATGWQNRVISGTMTAVASKLAPESGLLASERQQFVLTFTAISEHRIQPAVTTPAAGLVAGDLIYGEVDIEVTSVTGVVTELSLAVFDFDGAVNISQSFDMVRNLASGNPLPLVPLPAANGVGNAATTLKYRLKTAPIIYANGATPTQLHWRVTTRGDAGSAITFIVANPQLRKI